MKRIKVEKKHQSQLEKTMFWILLMLMFSVYALANENNGASASEKHISITEFDFKNMVLDGKSDSLAIRLHLKKYLEPTRSWNFENEFMILTIPVNKGLKGPKPGNGKMISRKQKSKKWNKK